MFVTALPVRRVIAPVLLFTLAVFSFISARPNAQTPTPRLWAGGTNLVGPLKDGGLEGGAPMPLPNSVSDDGRFVVFRTEISTVVPGDTNEFEDIFVRDRLTNQTTRVNLSSSGDEANGRSEFPSISPDGRFVTFVSEATNLVPGDTNGHMDIFVHDLLEHTTSLVSRTSSDAQADSDSSVSAISAGGRYIVFISTAWNLAPNMSHAGQLFLRDRDVDGDGIFDEPGESLTTIISVADDGTPGYGSVEPYIDITPDGRFVAFASDASNLAAGDTNWAIDVFVRDLQAGHISRASVATDGTQTPAATYSEYPSISADGRYVVFQSSAATLVAGDTNGKRDIFLHDAQTGETTRMSVSTSEAQGDNASTWPSISHDGRYVAFQSLAQNFDGPIDFGAVDNAYVRDRQSGTTTAVNLHPDGWSLAPGTLPSISGDGSTVIFSAGSGVYTTLWAAVDLAVTPASVLLDANGTAQTLTVTTTPVTGWSAAAGQSWITVTDGGPHAGNGTLQVSATPNTGTTQRTGHVLVGMKTISVTQAGTFSVQAISPTSGTAAGGTTVTITGSGFTQGATVRFGGVSAVTTLVSGTTLTAVTSPHAIGLVDVEVTNGDGAGTVLPGGYRYNDTTPPVIVPTITGTLGNNGWYVTNVGITWSVIDPESAITSTSNCNPYTLASDTYGTTVQCTATSAGGTATGTTPTIKRDASLPWAFINVYTQTIYEPGQTGTVSYFCNDNGPSGVDTCVGTFPTGGAIDTSTPGFHDVTVTATDKAGWSASRKITYGVTTGVCTPMPADIVSWWSGDNTLTDRIGTNHGTAVGTGGGFAPGLVGPAGFQLASTNGITFGANASLNMTTAFSVSAWVNPVGQRQGKIFDKRGEYGLELKNTVLYYTFGTATGDAGFYEVPHGVWTHVAMTYDAGVLTIYANGRPVKTVTVPATLVDAMPGQDDFMVGRRQDGVSTFTYGNIDEVQVYRRALTPAELESMFLSGRSGVCVPAATALTTSPVTVTYGPDLTATLTARLTSSGVGVEGRTLAFSLSGSPVGTAVTDSNGNASIAVSLGNRNAGTYYSAISVTHQRDASYMGSNAWANLIVAKRPTTIVWAAPAPITYGTLLNSGMFNATTTETVSGSFAYTPSITSTPPNAGTVTLGATFTPSDTTNYLSSTASVTLQVLPATPTISFSSLGPYTYDTLTHSAYAYAYGAGGGYLGPATLTYNGSSTLPLNAGEYTVLASFPARPNYTAASATATLTILKRVPSMALGQPIHTYNGLPQGAGVFVAGPTENLTPVIVTYNGSTEKPVNAGVYNLVATYEGSTNYEAVSQTGVMEIRKATVSLSATLGSNSRLYNGTPQTVQSASATGVGGEVLPVKVTYNGDTSGALNAGEYAVVVSYEESQNYLGRSLNLGTLTIVKALPKFTLTGGARTVTYNGNPYEVTATAKGIFGEELTPLTITYNGSTTGATNAGEYTVLVSYGGSANYAASTSGTWLIIGKAQPQLSWAPPPSITYGQALGPAQLNATANIPGTFTYSPAAGTVPHRGDGGGVEVQATFTPDDTTNYYGGNSWRFVGVHPVMLAMQANNTVKEFGAPLPVFTVSFGSFVNGDTPASLTGSLVFATTATDQSPVGTYPITVSGLSSQDYIVAPIAGVLTVQPAATSMVVSSSANPSGVNQPVTFTATVSSTAPGQPTGTVTFLDGATVLGSVALQNGTASLTTILATGTHAITATYAGEGNFAASSSAPLNQTVNASSTSTTTTLSSSRNPSKTGQSVTLTARVTSPAGTPAGDVEFLEAGVVVGTATLSGSGTATLTTTSMAVGSHAMTVRYLGSATMPPSLSGMLVQVVNTNSTTAKSTATALAFSPPTGSYGTQTTFSVTVSPPLFNSAPTGNVLFTIDGVSSTVVALSTVSGKGIASLSTSTLPRGKHLVTVTYLGSGTYAGSTATLTYTVN